MLPFATHCSLFDVLRFPERWPGSIQHCLPGWWFKPQDTDQLPSRLCCCLQERRLWMSLHLANRLPSHFQMPTSCLHCLARQPSSCNWPLQMHNAARATTTIGHPGPRESSQQRLMFLDGALQMGPHEIWVPQRCAQNDQTLHMCRQFKASPHMCRQVHDPRHPFQNLASWRFLPCAVPDLRLAQVDADPSPRPRRILQQTHHSPHATWFRHRVFVIQTRKQMLSFAQLLLEPPTRGAVQGRTRGAPTGLLVLLLLPELWCAWCHH